MPILPIIQGVAGLIQGIFGNAQAKNNERKLENMVNGYQPNASIFDYYNKALGKYSSNPYTSNFYQNQQNQIGRNLATGINAAQDRRGGLGAIGALVSGSNDASRNAAVAAEGQSRQDLGLLGGATRIKAAEDFKPFEMKYNLLAKKAAGGSAVENAGIQNIFGGAGAFDDYNLAKQYIGAGKSMDGNRSIFKYRSSNNQNQPILDDSLPTNG